MGNRRLPDEEKAQMGTLHSGNTVEALKAKTVSKILEFPVMREIPKSAFPFNKLGQETFDYWAVRLRDAGMLTKVSFGQIENLALQDHIISKAMDEGRMPPQVAVDQRRKILIWLEEMNVSESVISGKRAKSVFATNGFPNRLRSIAEHQAAVA